MGEKTTIEIDNIRELKQHALDTNKTLKQLINEAIIEKIERERQHVKKNNTIIAKDLSPSVNVKSMTSNEKIAELKRTLYDAGLLPIVEKECNRHNVNLSNISSEVLTPELISDIHTAITLVFDDETAEQIIEKMEMLLED
jgi:hypothetical protein